MKFRLNWLTRLSLVVALLSASATAFGAAVTVTYNGVKYKSDKSQTYFMVVAAPYTGDIVVADSVKTSAGKTLPVTQVGSSAFSELEELTSVTLPGTVTKINDYAFDSATNLKTVKMSDNVTYIGHWAFRNCYNLENLELPDSLTFIGNYCFDTNYKMTKVTLPAKLKNIGGFAFEGNPQLKAVYSLATTPPAVKKGYLDGDEIYTIFDDNDYADRVLYVPAGTVGDYKLTFGWNQFAEIREINPTCVQEPASANADFKVATCGNKAISVTTAAPTTVVVYDLAGHMLFRKTVEAGETTIGGLNAGVVIVNGKKVLVK